MYQKYPEPPIDLKPFLKKGFHYSVAEALWNGIFAPLERLADKLAARWTRKFCEENIPPRERV